MARDVPAKKKVLGVMVKPEPAAAGAGAGQSPSVGGGDEECYRAWPVWGLLPWISSPAALTPDEAVHALEERLKDLGYEPEIVVFDTLEAAQAEGRRRLAAEDLLRGLEHARMRLPEILAGEGGEPDAHDQEALRSLDEAARAVRAVAAGLYDGEKTEILEEPPIKDGRLVCPECGPDYPEAYFTATADALVTAYLSPGGRLTAWNAPYVSEEEYRELECGSCGTFLGDLLTFEQLQRLEPEEDD